MKKRIIAGSSAVALMTLFGEPALAGERIKLSLGGKMEQYFGGIKTFNNHGGRKASDGFGIDSDTEVYFRGATTLDNGITVAVNIELEAEAKECCRNADEQYVDISGDFGKIRLGEKVGVYDAFAVRAPNVAYVQTQDVIGWMKGPLGRDGIKAVPMLDMEPTFDDDSMRLTYMSPSFYGVSLGVSYAPNAGVGDIGDVRVREGRYLDKGKGSNEIQVSLALDTQYHDIGIRSDIGFATELDGRDRYAYRAGLSLNYMGWTLGGGYMGLQSDSSHRGRAGAGNGVNQTGFNADIWEVGLSYHTGPYSAGLVYAQNNAKSGSELGDGRVVKLEGSYVMGPGIRAIATSFYAETDGNNDVAWDERKGLGLVTGLVLEF